MTELPLGKGQVIAAAALMNQIQQLTQQAEQINETIKLLYEGMSAMLGADLLTEQWELDADNAVLRKKDTDDGKRRQGKGGQ